jgi:hypothetical protein
LKAGNRLWKPAEKTAALAIYKKRNGLAIKGENLAKIHIFENKPVSSLQVTGSRKTRGEKMKDSLAMLLKTNVEKMSVYCLLAILFKTNELK